MKYCSECGGKLDSRPPTMAMMARFICPACGAIHHQSPRLSAGCIARWRDSVLLCRRAVPPGEDLWELPAGFVASGERADAAACREALEEAGVAVEIEKVYALLHLPHIDQLRVIYLAHLCTDHFTPGTETSAVRLFAQTEMPWNELAFDTTRDALRRYFEDRRRGDFPVFFAEIVPFRAGA